MNMPTIVGTNHAGLPIFTGLTDPVVGGMYAGFSDLRALDFGMRPPYFENSLLIFNR
jgi:acetyl-CoA carboxylase beta subunit